MDVGETAEGKRLLEMKWRTWGPYVSDRQWGTVREDYSANGDAWHYLPHDISRSRAYRWGEDGIGGVCDDRQFLCFGLALWNTKDPIIKERLFGLTGSEGNHGEDVKELYYYLDSTPTHSFMRMLYKYPQQEFPYQQLIDENRRRGKSEGEFELFDSGIFEDDKYFDVFLEYAKADTDDLLITIRVENRGRADAVLELLPQLWFRNTWSWVGMAERPVIRESGAGRLSVEHPQLGDFRLFYEGAPEILFAENETNNQRLFGVKGARSPAKDGINDFVVSGDAGGLSKKRNGSKAALRYRYTIAGKKSVVCRLRLCRDSLKNPFEDFTSIAERRQTEADEFYAALQQDISDADVRLVQRQAFAGMLWSKQFYYYDVQRWLNGDPTEPPPPVERKTGRNSAWTHLKNADVISMPDKWEYPWYAAWDLAFHCLPLAMVDPVFAKHQLLLLTKDRFLHPNGQLPAYEWAFGDVNPPVHAWACWRVYQMDRKSADGRGDIDFLERIFHKLLLNFTWWVNRKDAEGRNIFQGGFLGLDNIGVFDRSSPLPIAGYIEQSDGTAWMGMYSLNLMRIALELSLHNPNYQEMATKFFEHFLYIAEAMVNIGGHGIELWDDEDEFYYDVIHLQNGENVPIKLRSMVGLIPLFAVETLEPDLLGRLPYFQRHVEAFLHDRPELSGLVSRWFEPGLGERRLLSLLRGHRMKCLLRRMLDETEFLSPYGVRALSGIYRDQPYRFSLGELELTVRYQPGESDTDLFGGNSNWRGPVWMPVNYLLIESLQRFHHYYGREFTVECPRGSGTYLTLAQVAQELSRRLSRLFLRDDKGRRPVFGANEKFQDDPHFRDYLQFYEYFHAENGRGVGASHQTGWTGLIAKLLQPRGARLSHAAGATDRLQEWSELD
jgi:hypothetical protein